MFNHYFNIKEIYFLVLYLYECIQLDANHKFLNQFVTLFLQLIIQLIQSSFS